MDHIVKVLETQFVTHNVKRFKVEKPEGYSFVPGQATDVSIHKPGLENELRPFTFTSLPGADHLEFTIKTYPERHGLTEKLLAVKKGEEMIVHDVFGTIRFEGPGLFIAAGAGITPFIAIFRYLKSVNRLKGNTLLFANVTEDDIILKDELPQMLGGSYFDVIEKPKSGKAGRRIDSELVSQYLPAGKGFCYVCGPDPFTAAMVETLHSLGVADSQIILEK